MTATLTRVLVVDDDPTVLVLMRKTLQKAGFEVATAASGEAALDAFRAAPPDLVMLDVDMPGIGGFEVCERMRAEAGELMPIVMVTGMDDLQSVDRAYGAGATDFIAKPINWPLLGHRVRYLLRGYRALLDLRQAEARNAAILEAIPDLLFELDGDGRYIDFHSPRTDLLPARPEEHIGRTVAEMLPADAADECMQAVRGALERGTSIGRQLKLALPRGTCWFELSASRKAAADGERPNVIVLSRDITERKLAEERIARLAYFDSLTGLPNRQSFLDRVDLEIQRSQRNGRGLGVLFMDLDGFKSVNDTMGHNAGDLILQWAADRLRQALRATDLVSRPNAGAAGDDQLARLGGDEFTALIPDLQRPEDAHVVARRILQALRRPFVLNGLEVILSASIGIALYPDDGPDGATLLKHADTAMYHAKAQGRDNCQFYRASLTEQALQKLELESSLRMALERNEFHVVYQPQFDSAGGHMHSVEALLRWTHPVRGAVPPLEFIPLAEANGMIVPIGQWVLETACADAARWQREGHRVRVAVNLSPIQFRDPNLLKMVTGTLQQTGLDPELLELEITEGALMEDTDETIATLNALREARVNVALDDFGTGYSSMSYLKRMPLSNLKIDRSFVNGLPHDAEDFAIVRAILSLAKSLGFNVTAEGVETREQMQTLKGMACDMLQGFYLGRPVRADDIPVLITDPAAREFPVAAKAVAVS